MPFRTALSRVSDLRLDRTRPVTTRQDVPTAQGLAHYCAGGMWPADAATDNSGMAPPYRERRKHFRRPVFLNCRIEGTTVAGPLQLTDLSESGCFIATGHPLALDSQVTLFVTLAGDEIRIIGRVVRVHPGRGVGVEINLNLLSQYARLVLEDFLRQPAGTDRLHA